MPYARNVNPEWGYVAPAPSVMRMARLILVAAIIGATAGAATVFSLPDRPVAQESVAARTLVAPDSRGRLTASTSVAAQQPTAPTLTSPAMDMSHGTGTSPATVRGDRSHGDRRDAV